MEVLGRVGRGSLTGQGIRAGGLWFPTRNSLTIFNCPERRKGVMTSVQVGLGVKTSTNLLSWAYSGPDIHTGKVTRKESDLSCKQSWFTGREFPNKLSLEETPRQILNGEKL